MQFTDYILTFPGMLLLLDMLHGLCLQWVLENKQFLVESKGGLQAATNKAFSHNYNLEIVWCEK